MLIKSFLVYGNHPILVDEEHGQRVLAKIFHNKSN
jgi:hypothetical protein